MRVLVVSNDDFNASHWTNRQHVAETLVTALGHEVLYLDTKGYAPRRPSPQVVSGVRVSHTWNVLPFTGRAWAGFSREVNFRLTDTFGEVRSFRPDLAITYDPLSRVLVSNWRCPVIYDCVDAYETQPQFGGPVSTPLLRREERRLAARVTKVVVTSPGLLQRFAGLPALTEVVPNAGPVPEAIDFSAVAAAQGRGVPVAAYVGAFDSYKIDAKLMLGLIRARPDWTFRLAGALGFGDRISPEVRTIVAEHNVDYRGIIPREGLRDFLSGASVGLAIGSRSQYSETSFPLKVWDYLASGLAVVAVNLPTVAGLGHDVYTPSADISEIGRVMESVRSEVSSKAVARRWGAAAENTYPLRVRRLLNGVS